MVESYKKYVLTCLICKGIVPPIPSEVEGIVMRHIKSACSHYIQLSELYVKKDIEQLQQFCQNSQQVFLTVRNNNNILNK